MPNNLTPYTATVHHGSKQYSVFVLAPSRKAAGREAIDHVRQVHDYPPQVQLIVTLQEGA